jgi:hypothetical protein
MSSSNSPNTPREASLSDLLSETLRAVTTARTGNANLTDTELLMLQHEIERLQREERRARTGNTAEDDGDLAGTTLVTDIDLATSETHHEENEHSLDAARSETIEEDFPSPTFHITEMTTMNARGRGFRMTSDGVLRGLIRQENGDVREVTISSDFMDAVGSSPTSGLTFHDPTSPFVNGSQPDRPEGDDRTSRVIESNDLGIRDLETQSNSLNGARAASEDDDDWVPQATIEIGESSESTEHQTSSDEGSLHPLLGSHATLHRENASVSSTGATVGSAIVGEEAAEPDAIEELRAVRRVDLMRQMAADIERYSRQRERAFHTEHGYCRYSPESSPERERPPIRRSAAPSPESSLEQGRSLPTTPPSIDRAPTRVGTPVSRSPNISPERERSPAEQSAALSPETRRPPTRRILYTGPPVSRSSNREPQPRQRRELNRSAGRTDLPEDFLRFLVDQNENRWPRNDIEERFDEDMPGDAFLYTYSLASSVQVPPPPTVEQTESFRRRITDISIRSLYNSGGIPFIVGVMLMAETREMDPREGEALLNSWSTFSTRQRGPRYPNIPGQLEWEDMLIWTAVRRGWGTWRPNDAFIQDVRGLLQNQTEFDHTPTSPLRVEITRDRIIAANLPRSEKTRFLQLWDDRFVERRTPARIERILSNWNNFAPRAEQTRLESEREIPLEELRLDRLERLIREETIVNTKRYVSKLLLPTDRKR